MLLVGDVNLESVKRCYIGTEFNYECECGEQLTHDFSDQYLMYPEVGETDNIDLYCPECGNEYSKKVTVVSAKVELRIE